VLCGGPVCGARDPMGPSAPSQDSARIAPTRIAQKLLCCYFSNPEQYALAASLPSALNPSGSTPASYIQRLRQLMYWIKFELTRDCPLLCPCVVRMLLWYYLLLLCCYHCYLLFSVGGFSLLRVPLAIVVAFVAVSSMHVLLPLSHQCRGMALTPVLWSHVAPACIH